MNDAFIHALQKLLGRPFVIADEALLGALATPSVKPGAFCKPGSTEELAAVVRLARQHKVAVAPCGGWTAMDYGHAAPDGALMLSTQRLDGIAAYEPADLVVSVQAGMPLGALQKILAAQGQWLPLDGPDTATIGGLVATDAHGPRALGYGTLRDMVLGMTVVNGDGVVRRCGGRVVKNVTGYALERLYIGALGTLGIVTEVTFKLRPLPETASVQEISGTSFEDGFALVRDLVKRLPFAAATVSYPAKPFSAQLGIEATPADQARLLRELDEAATAAGGTVHETGARGVEGDEWASRPRRLKAVEWKDGHVDEPPLWARLRWPARANEFPDQMVVLDALAAQAHLGLFMGFFDFPARASCELFGPLPGETQAHPEPPQLDRMVSALREAGIPATVVWRAEQAALVEPVWGPPRPDWALMRSIKSKLDPDHVLNAGRFIEGI